MGALSWYLRMLDARPIITKSISAGLIYGAADLTAQSMTIGAFSSLDLIRTLRIAIFGLLLLGPVQHVWFNLLGRMLPKRDMITTFKKLIVGQIFYGPSCTAVFFIYNAFLQGESGIEIGLRLKRDLLPTLTSGLMYWPVCDFFTYKIIPVHLQPLVNSSFSFMWTIYLTYMFILSGVKTCGTKPPNVQVDEILRFIENKSRKRCYSRLNKMYVLEDSSVPVVFWA